MTLTCIECGEMSDDGEGWKGELAVDLLDEAEPDEVAVYRPGCWEGTAESETPGILEHLFTLG